MRQYLTYRLVQIASLKLLAVDNDIRVIVQLKQLSNVNLCQRVSTLRINEFLKVHTIRSILPHVL